MSSLTSDPLVRHAELVSGSNGRREQSLTVGASVAALAGGLARASGWMLKQVQHDGGKKAITLSLLLAACSGPKDDATVPGSTPIECKPAAAAAFAADCTMEKTASPEGVVLVVRARDGGFRRLLVVKDGRGVIAADGAEQVIVRPAGVDHIDVTAGDMTYRLPAKIAP